MKILIVDDSALVRTMVKDALEEKGHTVIEAADGEEGFRLATQEKPEVVILDLTMPKKDGLDVCAQIREKNDMDDVHIIMLTSRSSEFDQMVGKEVGADAYLPKPFETDELLDILGKVVDGTG